MEVEPSWEAASCAAIQELPNILWNLKVHYRVCKSIPLVSAMSQINPVHTTHPVSLRSSLISLVHLYLGLPSCLLPSGFTTNILCVFYFSSPPTSSRRRVQVRKLVIIWRMSSSGMWRCGARLNRRFGWTYRLLHQGENNQRNVLQMIVTANVPLFISTWWRWWYTPPKRRFLQKPHGVMSQETAFLTVTAVKISNLTQCCLRLW
jgi:hypothetical protein